MRQTLRFFSSDLSGKARILPLAKPFLLFSLTTLPGKGEQSPTDWEEQPETSALPKPGAMRNPR